MCKNLSHPKVTRLRDPGEKRRKTDRDKHREKRREGKKKEKKRKRRRERRERGRRRERGTDLRNTSTCHQTSGK
jgi:hypothetical protein